MKRNWVYDATIKRGLAFARRKRLDLGVDVVSVPLDDIESEGSVQPSDEMVEAIRAAADAGQSWPADMPLPVLAGEPGHCITLDGNHRIKAARLAGLEEVPAIVSRLSTWEAVLPEIDQEDVIPYEDFIAILAEAGALEIRKNLNLETKAAKKYGKA